MVLLAAQGLRNDQIAERLNCRREVVSQCRKRFFEQGMAGLPSKRQLRIRAIGSTIPSPFIRSAITGSVYEVDGIG
jgi:hypothetical protein